MFKRATKEKAKLRLALQGPAGSGKTFTALRIAKGIGGRVAVIDTERGSASKYSDRFEFDTEWLTDRSIEGYMKAIEAAKEYDVLIIDSASHEWQELLVEVDLLAKNKYRSNSFQAWSEGTPRQRKFIDALLDSPCHLIATMRSKTEWEITENEKGKKAPVRIGLAPIQGKDIEYEFDMLIEMSPNHAATILKDRTGKFQDKIIDKPGEEFGAALRDWLSDGAEPAHDKPAIPEPPATYPGLLVTRTMNRPENGVTVYGIAAGGMWFRTDSLDTCNMLDECGRAKTKVDIVARNENGKVVIVSASPSKE